MAEAAERKAGGQFQKGQSGNPRGRVRGVPNKISRKVLGAIAEHEKELVATLVDMALAGDVKALKICIERLSPVMREHPLPAVKLPAIETPEDLPKATGALLQAATSGTMTPGEVAALSAAVRVHVDALQTADLAERVRLLEEGGTR